MPTLNKGLKAPTEPSRKKDLLVDPIDQELFIDDSRLNEELVDQPLYFRKYTKLLSEVQKKAQYIKHQLEEAEAELYVRLSNDGTGKKVKELESAVALEPTIKNLKRELADADALQTEFEGIVKAFHHRHEMLKDLSANKRKDLIT